MGAWLVRRIRQATVWTQGVRAVVLALLFVACGRDASTTRPSGPPQEITTVTGDVQGTFVHVVIDGKPCIVWTYQKSSGNASTGYGGLTCDWTPR